MLHRGAAAVIWTAIASLFFIYRGIFSIIYYV